MAVSKYVNLCYKIPQVELSTQFDQSVAVDLCSTNIYQFKEEILNLAAYGGKN